ncbi:Uridine phosphorylase [Streptococcus sp. DD10]|uniref:nucleoside phosphorylase n=1 Tax=Streptococcus sp. DD10 TaxID=1777878 RepID=UPI00079A04E4|nr:nucleoside phosphorylase [Streptococcus sp. DD10]KXT74020.1 Uridine phosphorylase [Streptococcus sp. DD10]
MLLSEFDSNKKAIINPEDLHEGVEGFPEVAVSCFARTTFERMLAMFPHEEVQRTSMANIEIPIYRLKIGDEEVAIFNSPVGASACIAILEDLIVFGMKKLVLFGTCGVLDEEIKESSIIIPISALRDEGTSFHYIAPSDEIDVNQGSIDDFTDFLKRAGISYTIGKVWTTDGIYRETIGKLRLRKQSGAICVDMECSAVAALATFRGFELCQFFYAADHLSEGNWDMRNLSNHADLDEKDKIALLALEFALSWKKG